VTKEIQQFFSAMARFDPESCEVFNDTYQAKVDALRAEKGFGPRPTPMIKTTTVEDMVHELNTTKALRGREGSKE